MWSLHLCPWLGLIGSRTLHECEITELNLYCLIEGNRKFVSTFHSYFRLRFCPNDDLRSGLSAACWEFYSSFVCFACLPTNEFFSVDYFYFKAVTFDVTCYQHMLRTCTVCNWRCKNHRANFFSHKYAEINNNETKISWNSNTGHLVNGHERPRISWICSDLDLSINFLSKSWSFNVTFYRLILVL